MKMLYSYGRPVLFELYGNVFSFEYDENSVVLGENRDYSMEFVEYNDEDELCEALIEGIGGALMGGLKAVGKDMYNKFKSGAAEYYGKEAEEAKKTAATLQEIITTVDKELKYKIQSLLNKIRGKGTRSFEEKIMNVNSLLKDLNNYISKTQKEFSNLYNKYVKELQRANTSLARKEKLQGGINKPQNVQVKQQSYESS